MIILTAGSGLGGETAKLVEGREINVHPLSRYVSSALRPGSVQGLPTVGRAYTLEWRLGMWGGNAESSKFETINVVCSEGEEPSPE